MFKGILGGEIADLELCLWAGRFSLRGKLWSIEQERQLRELLKAGVGIAEISKVMGKTRVSVRSKMYHLGLCVVDASALQPIAVSAASIASVASSPQPVVEHNSLDCPRPEAAGGDHVPTADSSSASGRRDVDVVAFRLKTDGPLPSIEEKLRVLDAALVALETPGLSMAESARLNKIIQGTKIYQELFANFVNYRALENKVLELEKQLAGQKKEN
jgi:hypothetical protein